MTSYFMTHWTGQYGDPVTHTYPLGNGYRTYVPSLMRFIAPDECSPFDEGGINPYAYCAADPINHLDPSGHIALPIAMALGAGAAIGGKAAGSLLVRRFRGPLKRWIDSFNSDGNIGARKAGRASHSATTLDSRLHRAERHVALAKESPLGGSPPVVDHDGSGAREMTARDTARIAKWSSEWEGAVAEKLHHAEDHLAAAGGHRRQMQRLHRGAKSSHDPRLVKQFALEERAAGLARLDLAHDLIERVSSVRHDLGHELKRRLDMISDDHRRMRTDFDRTYLSNRVRYR